MRQVLLCVRGGRPPGARGVIQILGAGNKTYGVAEISSTCAPTTWPRSVRRVRLCAHGLSEIGPRFYDKHRLCRAVACSTLDCVSNLHVF